jgi:hypothetical protein
MTKITFERREKLEITAPQQRAGVIYNVYGFHLGAIGGIITATSIPSSTHGE